MTQRSFPEVGPGVKAALRSDAVGADARAWFGRGGIGSEANEARRVEVRTPKLLLTPEEAAGVLGVGWTKLYALMGEGLIESVRIGGSRRVPVDAIDRFVERLRGGETDVPE